MTNQTTVEIPVKPRVLIADDSRIVRATLIKHIEGMFEFREALDGEQAWETLLLDPNIRVVITDLTMPKLDGYGLLARIRNSKVSRIRNLPVVVVSGSDEQEERDRAKAAGATDLITKGIGTAQLLSRLDILARLATTQGEFERSLEALVRSTSGDDTRLLPLEAFRSQAEALLSNALKSKKNFVVLNVCVGLKRAGAENHAVSLPAEVVGAVGRLLHATVRESDCVARSGATEFLLATGSINFDAAHRFAERVCRAIAAVDLARSERTEFVASCGVTSLDEQRPDARQPDLIGMCGIAHRRALLGMGRAITGVVGPEEERLLLEGRAHAANPSGVSDERHAGAGSSDPAAPDLATMLQWIKDGRRDDVLPHIGKLSIELQPLVDLLLQKNGH